MSRKGLGASSPARRRAKPPKKGGHGTNVALAALLATAFVLSAATMFFAGPKIARSLVALDNLGVGGEGVAISLDEQPPAVISTDQQPAPAVKQKPKLPPEGPQSSISDLVSWILSGQDKDANTQHGNMQQLKDSPAIPLEFPPGSLSLTHAQTLRHCYSDPKVYGKHFQGHRDDGSRVPVSYSDKHKLAYVMLPKSGSSTARYMMKDVFHAKETRLNLQHQSFAAGGVSEGVEVLSFVRDPLSRFYSQYDEAYVQAAPWQKNSPYYADPDAKKRREEHPFPFIYDNLHSYKDYEDAFCPPSTRKNRNECAHRKSAENGTLAARFERFVREYDGRDPFDVHLTLQAPMMSSKDGLPLRMTQIYNTTDSDGGWRRIARQFLGENATFGDKGVISGRSYPRRFKSELVSGETQQRVCLHTLLDYCCLNLPLPEVCQGKSFSVDEVDRELFCILDAKGRIQPGIPPQQSGR
ncbi:hypothetical protein ACHAXT_007463 [Thalassiosira profunda]